MRRARTGLPDARLLLAPVLIAAGLDVAEDLLYGAFQLGWLKSFHQNSFTLFTHPFPITADEFIQVLFLIAMLAILSNRFMRSRSEEQRLEGEFEAARSVQSLLIPAAPPATPGFRIENVYLPAQEVGGDFFQVLPGDDGSLLIVVGDVSGKGLRAAMTVSAIVGALSNEPSRRPSAVLQNLNSMLYGRVGGFVTCCAALITEDGTMTISNAGHVSPYRNGEELTVPGGLPLGLLAEAVWDERCFELANKDRLTFVSDGVLEARNRSGELFGFERLAAISIQPAESIAQAAQAFGQEDDITVLSLTFAPVGVAHV